MEATKIIQIPYSPQPHQREWHMNPTRFLVAVTGRQIGKTTAAVNELIKRAISKPNQRVWYITNDYSQAKRNVWDEMRKYIVSEMGATFNASELKVQFPNGSKIELIGVENAESLRGAVVHFMVLDEYADFERDVWAKVLSPMFSTTKGDAWFIGTPKGMGNDLYDKFFFQDADTTVHKIPAAQIESGEVVSTTSKYADLGAIRKAYETLPKDAFDQEYMAEFTRPSGTVYSDWPLENYKEFDYDPNSPLHITFDWGINDPTAVIWLQPLQGEVRVVDYYEASDANIEHFISVISSKPYKSADLYTGDPAGKARTLTTGTSVIDLLGNKGIHVRTKDGVRIPDQIRVAHSFMKRLYVNSKTSSRFRDCLLNYRYPEIKSTLRNQENELPIHDQYSHAMRAFEYWCVNYGDVSSQKYNYDHPVYQPVNKFTGY